MKEDVILYENGLPVSDEVIRLIKVIEKTPKNKLISIDFADGSGGFIRIPNTSIIDLMPEQQRRFFQENPKAMFSYGRNGVRSSIFTNFGFSEDGKTIYYDIIRLGPFSDSNRYDDDDLVRVDKVDRHSGIEWRKIGLLNWYDIDFISPPVTLINWRNLVWEDLK